MRVVKRGRTTGVTEGKFHCVHSSVKINDDNGHGRFYEFKNCFVILDQNQDEGPFFQPGDSGSGVFQIDETNRSLYPIGIAFGRLNFQQLTCVCKIKDIAEKFNLSICQDSFSDDILKVKHDEENMDIN